MEIKPWKMLASKTAFKNRWWDIVQETVELPDGSVYDDYFVNRSLGGVAVFAVAESGDVLVNRQYKHGAREIIHELTVGRIEEGESGPLAAAKRELLEETGYGGGEWEELPTIISNPSSSTARLRFFLARGVRKMAGSQSDPRETVEAREVSPAELLRMAFAGELPTDVSLSLVLLAAKRLGWISETI